MSWPPPEWRPSLAPTLWLHNHLETLRQSLAWQLRSWFQTKEMAVLESCLIGLVSGLTAVLIKQGANGISTWRAHQAEQNLLWLPIIGLVGGWCAGWLTSLAPETKGSGIPQVKAALARVPVALNLRVAIVKLASTMLVLGSGIVLGRQGPTVQVGAALAAQLSQWVPTSPDYRRQMIAAGAAAGLAAGFNAPIAGVLFVVEELLQDVSGLTLGTAILASFIGAVVSRLLGGQGLQFFSTLPSEVVNLTIQELPLLLVLGVLAGVLGGLFSRGVLASRLLYQRFLPWSLPGRVAIAGLLSGCVALLLPEVLRDNVGLRDWLVEGGATWQMTALAFVSRFGLVLIATGSGASGGLFAPALVLGASLGYFVAIEADVLLALLPMGWGASVSSPATYVLTGMGAFFSAVTKGPITAIVIVFEMSSNFNLVLPLMIGSVTAYGIADLISPGSIYDRLLESSGLMIKKTGDRSIAQRSDWDSLQASDVMQRQVETLDYGVTLGAAQRIFAASNHRGFPVLADSQLVGILTQSDVAHAKHYDSLTPIGTLMTPHPVTVQPNDTLAHVLYLLNQHQISRLPVTDGRKLVGIITRADIIRAEVKQLTGNHCTLAAQTQPSYVVYQTRAPAVGRGRLLVPLANPATAPTLLKLAASLARDRHYELECLSIITVPPGRPPAETPVEVGPSQALLHQAIELGKTWNLPVHTQARVTHDVAQAILDTVRERNIDLTLMGWKGRSRSSDRVFGNAMDTLIRHAPCELVLVKLGQRTTPASGHGSTFVAPALSQVPFDRWLIPLGGGPNAQQALAMLSSLISLSPDPEIVLCQVHKPHQPFDRGILIQGQQLLKRHGVTCPVATVAAEDPVVSEAILKVAQTDRCDVIVLGATREGLLQQTLGDNIPEEIARQSPHTVLVVRTRPAPD
ncbi:MAG: chloride channel protein [Prochlorothrix sp.]